jgi:hypothetical protein
MPRTLVVLPALEPDQLQQTLSNLAQAFAGHEVVVAATPDSSAIAPVPGVNLIEFTPSASSNTAWTLTAADFLNAHELTQQHNADALLLLGADAQSLEINALRDLAHAILYEKVDLAVPRYAQQPRAGLVNSAILYPATRALFGTLPRFPLALDLGLSPRAAERMATAAQRLTATNQPDALVWPLAEVSVAGYAIAEVEGGPRITPQPAAQDLNSLLAMVAGSFFTDIEAKAAFWQRTRVAPASTLGSALVLAASPSASPPDAQPMIESFRLAFDNLREIWSLVLPPQSLFGLKRMTALPPASFAMPDSLWARIVYDFLLAYRLRTINRGHLLGAMTPLYLAWVASHILQTVLDGDSERHIEAVAAAFEAEKPYLVSRWRWPDRFNP